MSRFSGLDADEADTILNQLSKQSGSSASYSTVKRGDNITLRFSDSDLSYIEETYGAVPTSYATLGEANGEGFSLSQETTVERETALADSDRRNRNWDPTSIDLAIREHKSATASFKLTLLVFAAGATLGVGSAALAIAATTAEFGAGGTILFSATGGGMLGYTSGFVWGAGFEAIRQHDVSGELENGMAIFDAGVSQAEEDGKWGVLLGVAGGALHSASSFPKQPVQVSSWADQGIVPDLRAGRWVQLGAPTRANYYLTGLPGPKLRRDPIRFEPSKAPFRNSVTGYVDRGALQWPPGLEKIKGIVGQRVLRK